MPANKQMMNNETPANKQMMNNEMPANNDDEQWEFADEQMMNNEMPANKQMMNNEMQVFVTRGGECYHAYGCCGAKMPLREGEALRIGRRPCKLCKARMAM